MLYKASCIHVENRDIEIFACPVDHDNFQSIFSDIWGFYKFASMFKIKVRIDVTKHIRKVIWG